MKIAFFDIDGVLADDTHRVEFALVKKWNDYFNIDRVKSDGTWDQGKAAVEQAEKDGWTVAYLTGRREDLREVTAQWLSDQGFPDGALYMRPGSVRIPLANLKADFLERVSKTVEDVQVVLYDDDPEVARLVSDRLGADAMMHCTWHVKQKALVKEAQA